VRVWHEKVSRKGGGLQKIIKAIRKKFASRRFIRYGLLAGNLVVLGLIGYFVLNDTTSNKVVHNAPATQANALADDSSSNPLDQPSSADIAVNLARMTSLPETPAVSNQADSAKIELAFSAAGDVVVAKPQAVATALKSKKDIKEYAVLPGDNIPSVATKFGVTSDSIRWSNNLTGDALTVGAKIWMPPVSGIVYVIAAGDTPDSLAQKYNTTKEQIIAYNDAEIDGLKVGERVILPGAQQPAPVRATYTSYASVGFAYGFTPLYGGNGYDPGWCTYYVAGKLSVPNNWGNANTWDSGARASGWTVSSVPIKGAIGQSNRGSMGHVGIVEEVSADGTMIKYSDMNGLRGFGAVGYSDWVSVHSRFENFIYR
jgi:N-acetylmuramoyl-L-alanine amidase